MNRLSLSAAVVFPGFLLAPLTARSQVVINEFQYDDTGAGDDDREFVELYNGGPAAVDIGSWVLGGYDPVNTNPSTTIPTGTMIEAGGYFVIGNTGVLNVNHVVAANFLENDNEVMTLRTGEGTLVDAVVYEANKGVGFVTTSTAVPADAAAVAAQVGPGLFGNHQGADAAGSPLNATVSWGRYVDGRDTNSNGRDFGLRPSTPGTSNAPAGSMTALSLSDPTLFAPGAAHPGMAGTFLPVRAIDPTLTDAANNPNVITAPNGNGSKAWTVWDTAGGGDCGTSAAVYSSSVASFTIRAYLETTDMPVQFNATNVKFRGSEITLYGIGGGDALTNLTDLDGTIAIGAGALPVSDTANGFTGICWVYERVAADPNTLAVSEKLYLVDANDGGDSDLGGNTPLDWTILATYNLSSTAPGWHTLSISLDAAGNGTASYDGQTTAFTSPGLHSGGFNVGYRENLQLGTDATPDAILRPPSFTFPPSLGQLSFAGLTAGAINLTIPATPGQTIGVEYSTTLEAGSWTDLGDFDTSGPTGAFSDSDPVRLARPRGFYRAFVR